MGLSAWGWWDDLRFEPLKFRTDFLFAGGLHGDGGSPRHNLQRCARMKDLTLGIQNHIGFMGLRRRGAVWRASEVLMGRCYKT